MSRWVCCGSSHSRHRHWDVSCHGRHSGSHGRHGGTCHRSHWYMCGHCRHCGHLDVGGWVTGSAWHGLHWRQGGKSIIPEQLTVVADFLSPEVDEDEHEDEESSKESPCRDAGSLQCLFVKADVRGTVIKFPINYYVVCNFRCRL